MSKNKLMKLIVLSFLLVALSSAIGAQNYGCCCDPVTLSGNLIEETECLAKNYTFIGLPEKFGVSCDDFCQAKLFAPRLPVCGDLICEGDEAITCPSDCVIPTPKLLVCGSPDYIPPPSTLTITPLKGEKKFRLEFKEECPSAYVEVWRNRGGTSTTFDFIANVYGNYFIDDSPGLKWNTDYTYEVKSVYIPGGTSAARSATNNLGDLECWDNTLPFFCLNKNFYYQFEEYLNVSGYELYSGASFRLNFDTALDSAFSDKFNKAFYCTDSNKLVLHHSCSSPDVCAIDEDSEPFCIKAGPCDEEKLFGLYSFPQTCELDYEGNVTYCFFDRSKTIVDTCYYCEQGLECYDYKSEYACDKDNCGVGNCEWHNTTPSLGFGSCVNTKKSNCEFCDLEGSIAAPNKDAASKVFDACSEEKANALSVPDFECVYWKDYNKVLSCDEATCLHYSELQFTPPSPGIRLNPDNSISVMSNDPCHISVCQLDATRHQYRKNADGSTAANWEDCPVNDFVCEADYFPPLTSVFPMGQNQTDFLNIVVMDKQSKADSIKDYSGSEGYETYLCLKTGTASCSNAANFPFKVNTNRLILKNLDLKNGRTKLTTLAPGPNTLFFYSKDKYNNPELIKSVVFDACDNCQGPTLLEVRIRGGRLFGSTLFSSILNPVVTLIFDEPTEIISASMSNTPAQTIVEPGYKYEHIIKLDRPLTEDTFRLSVKAKNQKGISSDFLFTISIDTTLAALTISPADGAVVPSRDVDIILTFSKQADLKNVFLTHLAADNPFVLNESAENILADFSTSNKLVYSASFLDVAPGVYKLYVEAEDLRGIPIARESRFSVGVDDFIVLKEPKFGYSSVQTFSAEFETGIKYIGIDSECRYVFNLPSMPTIDELSFVNYPLASSIDGYTHKTSSLTIPYGDTSAHPLYIFCKKDDEFQLAEFDLFVDPTPPKIINAYAFPDVIAEQSPTNPGTYATKLKVETDKPTFCKYSKTTDNFDLMEHEFDGFDAWPLESHSAIVVVDEIKQHRYYVACESPAGVVSSPAQIMFSVDLTKPLEVNVVTDTVFQDLEFVIGVETNKQALCYLGEEPVSSSITDCFGDCTPAYVHRMDRLVEAEGAYDYYIQCIVPLTGDSSDILPVKIIIDQTSPEMLWINDSTTLEDPEVSYFTDRIRAAYLGNDSVSSISKYLVSVVESLTDTYLTNRTQSNVLDGSFHFIENLTLQDNKKYEVVVEAVDRAGLISLPISSDGVFINTSAEPYTCNNNITDGDETDVDCGGSCPPCDLAKTCSVNTDCASGLCDNNVCSDPVALCDNGIKDGDETDVDCGGSCQACANGLECYDDYDCLSNYCDASGVCKDEPSCEDGELSAGETDVDCGGPCVPCGEGMGCEVDVDCSVGLECVNSVCREEVVEIVDSDYDGVPDDRDFCPDTPRGEAVDEYGCSASQRIGEEVEEEEEGVSFLLVFLIILLLAGVGVGGYLLYKHLVDKGIIKPITLPKAKPKVTVKPRVKIPVAKPRVKVPKKPSIEDELEKKLAKLKKFAKELPEEGWIEVGGKKQSVKEAIEKLKFRLKESGDKDALKRLKQKTPKSADRIFEKLKKAVEEHKKKKKNE